MMYLTKYENYLNNTKSLKHQLIGIIGLNEIIKKHDQLAIS